MFPRGALDAKTRREKLCGTDATSDVIAGLFHADPAKALVMTYHEDRSRSQTNEPHDFRNGFAPNTRGNA
jgi:hypothetical protein